MAEAATTILAKSAELTVSLHAPAPPCLQLDVCRDQKNVAVIFANRSPLAKQSPVFTVYTGNPESPAQCSTISKLVHVVNRAPEALPVGAARRLLLPETLDYLQPLAEQVHKVRTGFDLESYIAQLLPSEIVDYSSLYEMIVEKQDLERIDEWLDANPLSPTQGKVFNLLMALDGLAQAGKIPPNIAASRLIERDTRTHDDEGNEW